MVRIDHWCRFLRYDVLFNALPQASIGSDSTAIARLRQRVKQNSKTDASDIILQP
jgi:hypothetical protein